MRDSCGNSESKGETPQAQVRRGGSRTARGKRVPEVEINVKICKTKKTVDKLDFHRVCLQSEIEILSNLYLFLSIEVHKHCKMLSNSCSAICTNSSFF